jgi:hypothetical protein
MLLQSEDKLLVVHRRLFERDGSRFFIGRVEDFDAGIVRVSGYTFVRDPVGGTVSRKNDVRTKLFSLSSGTLMVYVLPRDLDLTSARLVAEEASLTLTAGSSFRMDLSEWAHSAYMRVG